MAIKIGSVSVGKRKPTAAELLKQNLSEAKAEANGQVTRRPAATAPHWECRCGERNYATEKTCARCHTPRMGAAVAYVDDQGERHELPEATWARGYWVCTCGSRNVLTADLCPMCDLPRPDADPTARGKPPEGGTPAPAAAEEIEGEEREIPLGRIRESQDNPRRSFDAEDLARLAESLKDHGQLQNAVVRALPDEPDSFELVSGARRLRAAQLAGLVTLRCRVIEVSHQVAIELRGIENYRRENFNAIEEAIWFSQMLEDCGYNQTSLAERLQVSQEQISHRLRLLKLPKEWKDRVVRGELPPSHARLLVPWAERLNVLEALGEDFDPEITLTELENQIYFVVRELGRDLKRHDVPFKPSAKQLAELDVVTLKRPWGDQKIAMNVALYDQLAEAAKARKAAKAGKAAGDDDEDGEPGRKREPTAAERREKAEKAAAVLNKKLYRWKILWLQQRIAERVVAEAVPFRTILALLLHYTTISDSAHKRGEELGDALKGVKAKAKFGDYGGRLKSWESLRDVSEDNLDTAARAAIARWIRHSPESSHTDAKPHDVEAIAASIGVDVAKEFTLTEDFLGLHTSAQLRELAKEWKFADHLLPATLKRDGLIRLLMQSPDRPCPKELLKLKPVSLV